MLIWTILWALYTGAVTDGSFSSSAHSKPTGLSCFRFKLKPYSFQRARGWVLQRHTNKFEFCEAQAAGMDNATVSSISSTVIQAAIMSNSTSNSTPMITDAAAAAIGILGSLLAVVVGILCFRRPQRPEIADLKSPSDFQLFPEPNTAPPASELSQDAPFVIRTDPFPVVTSSDLSSTQQQQQSTSPPLSAVTADLVFFGKA